MEVNNENYLKCLKMTNFIDELILEIRQDTGMFSTHNHIFEHQSFKLLVNMGDELIPYLFHVVTHHGGSWVLFHLIHQITKENPVPKGDWGKFPVVMSCWLQWYLTSKYYGIKDVYYGLESLIMSIPNKVID